MISMVKWFLGACIILVVKVMFRVTSHATPPRSIPSLEIEMHFFLTNVKTFTYTQM